MAVLSAAELEATFAPQAGMVCCSLRHRGEELLAQRDGVAAYAERGATMGIPLLYPWANRLAGFAYEACGRKVDLAASRAMLKLDPRGLPIHGVIPGRLPWDSVALDERARRLTAELRWRDPALLAVFPFAHTLLYEAQLAEQQLTITTTVSADAGSSVPVSFGFHPYLAPSASERSSWAVRLPVRERLLLDERGIPTGAREPVQRTAFELGEQSLDDGFAGLARPAVFSVATPERELALELLEGYRFAQVYGPAAERFICFEPMTAPTNALAGGEQLPVVAPGESYSAAFRLSVRRPPS